MSNSKSYFIPGFEEEESNLNISPEKKVYKQFKKSAGISSFVLHIFMILLFLIPILILLLQKDSVIYKYIFPKVIKLFFNESFLYLFITITCLILIFGIVHISYIFTSKNFRRTANDHKVLTYTLSGYVTLSFSYLILFIRIISYPEWKKYIANLFVNQNSNTHYTLLNTKEDIEENNFVDKITLFAYGILGLVSTILLSIGLSDSKESVDVNNNNVHYFNSSTISPSLIALNSVIFGISPLLCDFYKKEKKFKMNMVAIERASESAKRAGEVINIKHITAKL
jgi:hypothetical protein